MPTNIDPTRIQPVAIVDPNTGELLGEFFAAIPTNDQNGRQSLRADATAAGLVLYIGRAAPGADPALPVWQIRNFLYDANNNVIFSGYPNGDPTYSYIWNSRAGYTYV